MTANSDYRVQDKRKSRKILRLPDYDYSQPGAYFITIVTQGRRCIFGNIEDGILQLSEYGLIAKTIWEKLPDRFTNIICDVFIIMPNHIHGIIEIVAAGFTPANERFNLVAAGFTPAEKESSPAINNSHQIKSRQPQGLPLQETVGEIVGAYKSLVSRECLKVFKARNEIMGKLWQRNYYEHAIRNEQDYEAIIDYIEANPRNWELDEEYIRPM